MREKQMCGVYVNDSCLRPSFSGPSRTFLRSYLGVVYVMPYDHSYVLQPFLFPRASWSFELSSRTQQKRNMLQCSSKNDKRQLQVERAPGKLFRFSFEPNLTPNASSIIVEDYRKNSFIIIKSNTIQTPLDPPINNTRAKTQCKQRI